MFASELVQFEVSGTRATMYVLGRVTTSQIPALKDACDRLPLAVQHLTISIDDGSALAPSAPTIVHELRRHWQATREGGFRVSFGQWTAEPGLTSLSF
jgi:hypothetical protein